MFSLIIPSLCKIPCLLGIFRFDLHQGHGWKIGCALPKMKLFNLSIDLWFCSCLCWPALLLYASQVIRCFLDLPSPFLCFMCIHAFPCTSMCLEWSSRIHFFLLHYRLFGCLGSYYNDCILLATTRHVIDTDVVWQFLCDGLNYDNSVRFRLHLLYFSKLWGIWIYIQGRVPFSSL